MGSKLRQDRYQRKDPEEYAQQQEFESVKIVLSDTTSNQSEMHDLILNTYSTLIAMKAISCSNDLSFVIKAVLAKLAIIFFFCKCNARVDEG